MFSTSVVGRRFLIVEARLNCNLGHVLVVVEHDVQVAYQVLDKVTQIDRVRVAAEGGPLSSARWPFDPQWRD